MIKPYNSLLQCVREIGTARDVVGTVPYTPSYLS